MSVMAARIRTAGAGRGALLVSLVVLAVFVYALWEIQTQWSTRSRLFGTVIAVPAIAVAAAQAIREARRRLPAAVPKEAAFTRSALAWATGFFALVWAIGFEATVPIFALAYLRLGSGESWAKAAVYAVATLLFVELLFVRLLHVPLPPGAIPLPGITS